MESIDKFSFVDSIDFEVQDTKRFNIEVFGMGWASNAEGDMCAQQNIPKGTRLETKMKARCGRGNKATIICTEIVNNNDRFCKVNIIAKVHTEKKLLVTLIISVFKIYHCYLIG